MVPHFRGKAEPDPQSSRRPSSIRRNTVNTCPQHPAKFLGAEIVLRRLTKSLTLTVAAAIALSLSASPAPAQVGRASVPVTVTPDALTFYLQLVGTKSAGKTVTFTNDGSADVYFTNIALTGVNTDQFTFTTTCGIGRGTHPPRFRA
jgi:hypothetical protein